MLSFKSADREEQERLVRDPWGFAEWIAHIPEANSRQLRHMILYLLYPDTFERIFGLTDRREIVSRLSEDENLSVDSLSPLELDKKLEQIRHSLETKYETTDIDFYVPPAAPLWKSKGFEHFTKDIRREHVLKALQDIDQSGVPPDARSTV